MIGWPGGGPIPEIFSICWPDGEVVDASEAALHQTVVSKFPILVTVGAEQVVRIIVPFVSKTHGNPVIGKCPQLDVGCLSDEQAGTGGLAVIGRHQRIRNVAVRGAGSRHRNHDPIFQDQCSKLMGFE